MHVTVDDGPVTVGEDGLAPEESPAVERRDHGPSTRYRYLLAVVSEIDHEVTIDRLVDRMARWEREVDGGRGERTWHDVHEELYRVDLPVLDQAGFLEFDVERGIVSTGTS